MSKLEQLQRLNTVKTSSVNDECFKTYGRIIEGYDFSDMLGFMETESEMPENGNVYYASVPGLEKASVLADIRNGFYGGMSIQAGYCNGKNSTMNGFEYHKGSEINIAATDLVLLLGHTWDIRKDNTYSASDAEAFFVNRGTAVELYETTLHLAPCKVTDYGFKAVVILPEGTNTPLEYEKKLIENHDELLLMKNKWVIAHPEREPLIRQGAFAGLVGENYEYRYK